MDRWVSGEEVAHRKKIKWAMGSLHLACNPLADGRRVAPVLIKRPGRTSPLGSTAAPWLRWASP
jgi:hypothetical protein